MIKILTGAYRRGSGTIRFDGREVDFRTPERSARSRYQHDLSGDQPGAVPLDRGEHFPRPRAAPLRADRLEDDSPARRRRCSIRSACRSMCSKPVGEFSTAIQQMVALARAVSSDAKMVIMDESTSSLDEREVELLFTVVRRLRDDGRAVIFVSHRLDELYALCDRVTVMRDGQTVAESAMADDGQAAARHDDARPHARRRRAGGQRGQAKRISRKRGTTVISATNLGAGPKVSGRIARCPRRRSRRSRGPARLGPHGNHAADVRRGSDASAARFRSTARRSR